jgi:DNA-binding cell septation regulator SpoVG
MAQFSKSVEVTFFSEAYACIEQRATQPSVMDCVAYLRGHNNLYVYEPNRLSRNTEVFDQIWTICKKQKHKIVYHIPQPN